MNDSNLTVLNKLVELYEDLITHNGYGDINISVRLADGHVKEVKLHSGKTYSFRVSTLRKKHAGKTLRRYRVVEGKRIQRYEGPERRSSLSRRDSDDRRLRRAGPRNFRLERRLAAVERRTGRKGRRWND